MFVDHSIRYPNGSGNRLEWQHSLPLSEAIRKGTRPKLRLTESLPTTLMSGFLRTFNKLLQTLLDFQSLPLNENVKEFSPTTSYCLEIELRIKISNYATKLQLFRKEK